MTLVSRLIESRLMKQNGSIEAVYDMSWCSLQNRSDESVMTTYVVLRQQPGTELQIIVQIE